MNELNKEHTIQKYLLLRMKANENGDPLGEFCKHCHSQNSRTDKGYCKNCGATMQKPYGFCYSIPVYDASDAMVLGINA